MCVCIYIYSIIYASYICLYVSFLGQCCFASGAFVDSFALMEVGRFIIGLGGESLVVAQNTYASKWFHGKALNMVFGLQLSIASVGSTFSFQVMDPIYESMLDNGNSAYHALGQTLFLGGLVCVVSFICATLLGLLDARASRIIHQENTRSDMIVLRDALQFPKKFWFLCLVCVSYYVAIFPFISLGQVFYMRKFSMDNANANFIDGK